jgi:hypothetical protein
MSARNTPNKGITGVTVLMTVPVGFGDRALPRAVRFTITDAIIEPDPRSFGERLRVVAVSAGGFVLHGAVIFYRQAPGCSFDELLGEVTDQLQSAFNRRCL